MTDALQRVLELADRHAREGSAGVPEAVLEEVVRATEAEGGTLGRGKEVLARWGRTGQAGRRLDLATGRDQFWMETVEGRAPDPSLCLAARLVLSSWMVREELKKARFAERRRLWEVESLRAIAEVLGGTLESAAIADTLVLHATALLDARRGEVWLAAGDVLAVSSRSEGARSVGPCPDGTCIVAARIGGAVLTSEEAASLPDAGLLEDGRLAVPIVGRRGRLGAVALAEREVRGGLAAFGSTDAETLALFASQSAVALENATLHEEAMERQLLERELELAASVQRELLPTSFAAPPGIEISARTEPCRQVGGDVYDLVSTPRSLVLMAGDVSGKGVPAALMASSLQSAVRLLARTCADVGELATQVHQHLLASTPENKFATVFLASLQGDGGIDYVSAGHNPVIVVERDGTTSLLHSSGPPLGLLPRTSYERRSTTLAPGALLLAYTDGFSEAPGAATGEDFGVERLVELAVALHDRPLEVLVSEIFASVTRYTGNAPAHDDRTLLVVRRAAA
ncbi:MAG: PP2C family protein-serine/threonine phosphatase [Acidobacteriota bacterium]